MIAKNDGATQAPHVEEPLLELGLDTSAPAGARLSPERLLQPGDTFVRRHIGPSTAEVAAMLAALGLRSLDELVDQAIPASIRRRQPLRVGSDRVRGERDVLEELRGIARLNRPVRSYLGMGYHDTITPPPVLRNILENPGWYTQYTPYQAEIAQGRLEALLNFQTLVSDLTGLPLANASLLDEATAAAEAVHMVLATGGSPTSARAFWVADDVHPQVRAVVETRAAPLGVTITGGSVDSVDLDALKAKDIAGLLVGYPATDGRVRDLAPLCAKARALGLKVVVTADLLALTLLRAPGDAGADIVVGSASAAVRPWMRVAIASSPWGPW
jgi:glycine dehydrogenase